MTRYILVLIILTSSNSFAQSNCLLVNQKTLAGDQIVSEQRNTYNETGKILEEWKLNSVGIGQTYTSKIVFEYNGKGYLTKISEFLNNEFKNEKTRTYDNLGRLISETQSNDPAGVRILNTLTSLNGISQKLYFDENNDISGKEITIKNSENQVVKYEIRNAKDQVNHSVEYQYNDLNKEIYVLKDDVAGHIKEEKHFGYDNIGMVIKDSTYLNNNLNGKTLYEYTDGFLSKKTIIDRKNKVDYEILFTNNIKGLVLVEKFIYHGELLNSIQREYDQNKNMVLEKRFNNQNQLLRTKNWEYTCPN
jgi:uncharacterized protein (DUF4213/DUF364 family)